MKKLLCFLLCLTLIFSSVSLCFADFGSNDSTNLYNISQYTLNIKNLLTQTMPTYNQVSNISGNVADIYTRLGTINTSITSLGSTLNTIAGYLHVGSDSISSIVNSILSLMRPIYNSVTSIPTDLSVIQGLLGFPTTDNSVITWNPYLKYLNDANSNVRMALGQPFDPLTNAHTALTNSNGDYSVVGTILPGSFTQGSFWWPGGSPLGNIANILRYSQYNDAMMYSYKWQAELTGYDSSQTYKNWADLTSNSFTPTSSTNGIYTWLSKIQEPVSRLSYVLASDERIEAQEAAAANEEAVVNNFIDSTGNGATSPSDISSVSNLSTGYKQNFGTDASPSGIFDIFNSDHASWFNQETKNQLDTTTPTRLTKSSKSETPLLDKQIDDIYNALGVKKP